MNVRVVQFRCGYFVTNDVIFTPRVRALFTFCGLKAKKMKLSRLYSIKFKRAMQKPPLRRTLRTFSVSVDLY